MQLAEQTLQFEKPIATGGTALLFVATKTRLFLFYRNTEVDIEIETGNRRLHDIVSRDFTSHF